MKSRSLRAAALGISMLGGMLGNHVFAQELDATAFKSIVDECTQANAKDEFSSAADVVAKILNSCDRTGVTRLPGRGQPVLGDILKYNADERRLVWNSTIDATNRFYGGGVSPYPQTLTLDTSGRMVRQEVPHEVRQALDQVGNANFWLLPLFEDSVVRDTYEARNGFGAEANVMRVRGVRYGLATRIPPNLYNITIMSVPMEPERARAVVPNLDVVLNWTVSAPCLVCFKAHSIERGQSPTVRAPLDEKWTTKFLFVRIDRIDLIDRVTGEVVSSTEPNSAW